VGNGDILDIVVRKNIRISNVIVYDILGSDHLPIVFNILDHIRTSKVTDWERFHLISPTIEINSGVETDKAARAFTSAVASAYRL
jgi:hypothetical protein